MYARESVTERQDNENGFAGAFGGDGGTCEFPQTYISSVVTSTEGKYRKTFVL